MTESTSAKAHHTPRQGIRYRAKCRPLRWLAPTAKIARRPFVSGLYPCIGLQNRSPPQSHLELGVCCSCYPRFVVALSVIIQRALILCYRPSGCLLSDKATLVDSSFLDPNQEPPLQPTCSFLVSSFISSYNNTRVRKMSNFYNNKKTFQKTDNQAAPTQAQPKKDTNKESKGK